MMNPKVSLVLSGGGARGIAHIGVIEELEKQGLEIFSISGTSMGAIVGAVYALGKLEEYKKWLFSLDKIKIFSLIDFTLNKQGFVKGDKLFNEMKKFISDADIQDLPIHYTAVATDIINKKEVVFTSGSIYDAIRASSAIPTVFTPIRTETGLLIDGGIINNIPMNHAKRISGDLLIASNVNADIPFHKSLVSSNESVALKSEYHKKIKKFYNQIVKANPSNHEEHFGYFNLINRTISLMAFRLSQISLETNRPDILIQVSHETCSIFDFYKAEEMVERGRSAAREAIGNYRNNLK